MLFLIKTQFNLNDLYKNFLNRFLDEYKKYNITFWAISTGNEPSDGVVPIERFNSLGWWPWTIADWIANHFGPQLRNSSHSDTLILTFDDQRILLPFIVDLVMYSVVISLLEQIKAQLNIFLFFI